MIDLLTFGETMGALRSPGLLGVSGAPALSIAGAESNVAIGASRLGHRTAWASVLGTDAIGDLIVRTCAAEGVNVHGVRRAQGQASGILVSQQRPMGRAKVDYHRTASAFTQVTFDDVAPSLDPAPRAVHISGITPALGPGPAGAVLQLAKAASDAGITVSFDVNFRSRLWADEDTARERLKALATYADVVFGGPEELALLVAPEVAPADLARAVQDLGPSEVVTKLGAEGARTRTGNDEISAPAFTVDLRDPIGAGDAFVAGFLSGLLDGIDVDQRLRRANTCGALAVATPGDWEGLPTRADLDLFDSEAGEVLR